MKYKMFEHTVEIEGKTVKTYGIEFEQDGRLCRREDISTDEAAVTELTKKLNYGDIDSVHFDSVLEDFYATSS